MPLRLWTVDLAREQSLGYEHLRQLGRISVEAGYDGIGLYLEHRFAYPSIGVTPGTGALEPETVRSLQREFPGLQWIPFVNVLGHMEGFLYTAEGGHLAENPHKGMQACPSRPETVEFATRLLDDVLSVFDSDLVHLGGDETTQLSQCDVCAVKPKAHLFAEHFGPLCQRMSAAGRRPAIWGDMVQQHPEALSAIPNETLLFDWQYAGGVAETASGLVEQGYGVVGCPTLHVYDAAWMHVPETEANVRMVSRDVLDLGLEGTCLTTWEYGLFSPIEACLPAVHWAAKAMEDPDAAPSLVDAFEGSSAWANSMGVELNALGGPFAFDRHRFRPICRLLLYGDPFTAWRHHREEFSGQVGAQALHLCNEAAQMATSEAEKGVTHAVRSTIEFIGLVEQAALAYDNAEPETTLSRLAVCRTLFDSLRAVALGNQARFGGSAADPERCTAAKGWVETVMRRVQNYGRGELGYRPRFDVLTRHEWVPHDQACWWMVNSWGR